MEDIGARLAEVESRLIDIEDALEYADQVGNRRELEDEQNALNAEKDELEAEFLALRDVNDNARMSAEEYGIEQQIADYADVMRNGTQEQKDAAASAYSEAIKAYAESLGYPDVICHNTPEEFAQASGQYEFVTDAYSKGRRITGVCMPDGSVHINTHNTLFLLVMYLPLMICATHWCTKEPMLMS